MLKIGLASSSNFTCEIALIKITRRGKHWYDFHAGSLSSWNWKLECWFLWREENRRPWRKTFRARTRTNNKLNPHMPPGRNRTRATLVGSECSHHCSIHESNSIISHIFSWSIWIFLVSPLSERHICSLRNWSPSSSKTPSKKLKLVLLRSTDWKAAFLQ